MMKSNNKIKNHKKFLPISKCGSQILIYLWTSSIKDELLNGHKRFFVLLVNAKKIMMGEMAENAVYKSEDVGDLTRPFKQIVS